MPITSPNNMITGANIPFSTFWNMKMNSGKILRNIIFDYFANYLYLANLKWEDSVRRGAEGNVRFDIANDCLHYVVYFYALTVILSCFTLQKNWMKTTKLLKFYFIKAWLWIIVSFFNSIVQSVFLLLRLNNSQRSSLYKCHFKEIGYASNFDN